MKTTTILFFCIVTIFLCITTTTTTFVLAGSPPCNCNNGKAELTAPRCVCKCDGEYMAPYCAFTATEKVRIEVWFDIPVTKFISTKTVEQLKSGLSSKVNASLLPQIKFLYNKPSMNNKTLALFDMPGMAVNWLYHFVWNAGDNSWPRTQLKITAVYFTEELSAPDGFLNDLLRTTYLYNDGFVVVSLSDVIWLLGVIVFVIAIVVVEKVYTTNDEKMIEQDIAMGTLDPVPSSADKYKS